MKNIECKILINIALIAILIGLSFSNCFGQIAEGFNYQTILRTGIGLVMPNKNVSLKFDILKNNISGNVVYSESQTLNSNSFGLITAQIGSGNIISGNFSAVNWGNDNYFLKVELDTTAGSNFVFMGTSQLLSVPYSMYAKDISDSIKRQIRRNQTLLYLEN